MKVKTSDNNIMYALICIIVFFTTSDLIATIFNQLTIASISSILSGIAVFIGANKLKVARLDDTVSSSIDFIKKNFNKSSIIFSILDIICTFIALFTGIIVISLIFRATFAVKVITVLNKFQIITRFILVGSLIYVIRRYYLMSELKMTTISWVSLAVFILGMAYGVLSNIFPQIAMFGDAMISTLTSCGISTVAGIVGIFQKGAQKTQEELNKDKEKLAVANSKQITKMAKAQAKTELKEAEQTQFNELVKKHEAIIIEEQKQIQAQIEQKANTSTTA